MKKFLLQKIEVADIDTIQQMDKDCVAKKMESEGRILSMIKKAESKHLSKNKIIAFLKDKQISESKIIEAYSEYYQQEGLYEISFLQRPLGFSVIMDPQGKNAIVSSIQDKVKIRLGMKLASKLHEVNGKRVDGMKHKDILKLVAQQLTPFHIVFKKVYLTIRFCAVFHALSDWGSETSGDGTSD